MAAAADGVDRSEIERNANGSEEPSSADPELWNIGDGHPIHSPSPSELGSLLSAPVLPSPPPPPRPPDNCEVDILVKYKMGGQMW